MNTWWNRFHQASKQEEKKKLKTLENASKLLSINKRGEGGKTARTRITSQNISVIF